VHADFHNVYRLVHGSHMAQLGLKVRTMLSGKTFTVEFAAAAEPPFKATVRDETGRPVKVVSHGSGAFNYENVAVTIREKKFSSIGSHGSVLTINNGRWLIEATSKPFPNPAKNPGKALLDVQVNAVYDADKDVVAPHGLIGQSWDGDSVALDGALDDYTGKEVTTKAMAEGAIEGVAADYEMEGPFATAFKYSRYDATAAKPRDVSKLAGKRVPLKKGAKAGASPDVAEAVTEVA